MYKRQAQGIAVFTVAGLRSFEVKKWFKAYTDSVRAVRAANGGIIEAVHPHVADTNPFTPVSYTHLDVYKRQGTLDDVKTLVARAHEKGMRVIFDWVANHTSWDNAWMQNKTWYTQDAKIGRAHV